VTGPSAAAIAASTRRSGAWRSHSSTLYGSLRDNASTTGTTAGVVLQEVAQQPQAGAAGAQPMVVEPLEGAASTAGTATRR
jgi:hypothetical protein